MIAVGFPTTCIEGGSDFSYTGGPLFSEDDDELTESKIRAFLDEKVLFYSALMQSVFKKKIIWPHRLL